MMNISTILKWISGGLEGFFGIPILGGAIIIGTGYAPLGFLIILHIVTLIFSIIEGRSKHGSILGIITNCLAWIPVLGMFLHIATSIVLLVNAFLNTMKKQERENAL
jgi:predicted membrane protein